MGFLVTEAVCRARPKQVGVGFLDLFRVLLKRCDVVEDPKAAAIGTQNQVVEVLLDGDPVHGYVRQIVLEGLPLATIVERYIDGVFRAGVEQALAYRILANTVSIAMSTLGYSGANQFP
jgi:hypothetical protein